MNAAQEKAFNKLLNQSCGEVREVTFQEVTSNRGTPYFIIRTNYKQAPSCLANKSLVGMIGKRGKVTIF